MRHVNLPHNQSHLFDFNKAVKELGLKAEVCLTSGIGAIDLGIDAARIWRSLNPSPEVIPCYTDTLVMRLLRGLQHQEATQEIVNIPKDLKAIGFDDLNFTGFAPPPLTTIAQPNEALESWPPNVLFAKSMSRHFGKN